MTCLSDHELTRALIELECPVTKQTLGIPLISDKNICLSCSGELLLRRDRPGRVTLYTESLGTVLASHYHKYCRNSRKGCKFTRYYGYYKSESGEMYYNEDWNTLPYFLSTQEIGFDLEMLRKFDAELLIGQISYKQKQIYTMSQKVTPILRKFAPLSHLTRVITKVFMGMYIKKYDLFSQTVYIFFFRIQQRQSMDRRRFEAAPLKYACLRVVNLYPKFLSLDAICFDGDINTTMEVITPLLFCGFEAKYAGLTLHLNIIFVYLLRIIYGM